MTSKEASQCGLGPQRMQPAQRRACAAKHMSVMGCCHCSRRETRKCDTSQTHLGVPESMLPQGEQPQESLCCQKPTIHLKSSSPSVFATIGWRAGVEEGADELGMEDDDGLEEEGPDWLGV